MTKLLNNDTFKALMLAFLIAMLVLGVSSCITEKKRAEICATCPTESFVKDSIIVKVKDTTIWLTLPAEKLYLPNPCSELCDSLGRLKPSFKPRISHRNGLTTTLKVQNDSLVISCKADSLMAVIQVLQVARIHSSKEVRKIIEYKTTRTEDFWIRLGQILLLLLALFGVYKLVRWKFKRLI